MKKIKNSLWLNITLSFVVAISTTLITGLIIILVLSEVFTMNKGNHIQKRLEDSSYLYEEIIEDAIISGKLDSTRAMILVETEKIIDKEINRQIDLGAKTGVKKSDQLIDYITEIITQLVTPLLIFIILISSTIGIILGLIVSRRYIKPINRIVLGTIDVGKNILDTKVESDNLWEFQKLSESFNKMTEKLTNSENQQRQLIADISHELLTPLTVLEGNIRGAIDSVIDLDEEKLLILYSQTNHLIRLVKDLKEISNIESNILKIEKVNVDINDIVKEVFNSYLSICREKELDISLTISGQRLNLEADPVRIKQVLFNILKNAIRNTPPKGSIIITTMFEQKNAVISIKDTGIGIEQEKLELIFNRLYMAEESRCKEYGGTGLGLSISKLIIQKHSGHIKAISPGLGLGSTFKVYIPLI